MAYKVKNWSNNESVTASDLNRIELGIADAHAEAVKNADDTDSLLKDVSAIGEDIAAVMDELEALREALNNLSS